MFLRMILVMGVSLFTSRVILKTLGVEDFGIYNVVGSVVVFFSFLQAALKNATYRYLAFELGTGNIEKLRIVYSMAIHSHIVLAIFLLILLEIGGVWFLNSKLNIPESRLYAANWAFQFSLLAFCIGVVRTPLESNIIAHEKMDFYAIISIFEVLAKLAIVYLLMIIAFDKLITYSFLLAAVYVLLSFLYLVYCKVKFKDCIYVRCWDLDIVKQFCSYSGWSLLVNGACIIRTQSISIFFNIFLGVVANAALGIANQVVSALNSFVTSFTQAYNPQIIKSYASKEYDYFYSLIYSTSKISYYLLFIISLPIVLNIDFILKIWLGDYPEMAPVFIETIIIYYLIDALQAPLVTAVHATGKLGLHQSVVSLLVLLIVPISYKMLLCGVPAYWVLIFNAFSNFVCAVFRVIYLKSLIYIKITNYYRFVLRPIISVTIFSIPLPLLFALEIDSSWRKLFITSFIAVFNTLILIYFLGLEDNEKLIISRLSVVTYLKNKCLK